MADNKKPTSDERRKTVNSSQSTNHRKENGVSKEKKSPEQLEKMRQRKAKKERKRKRKRVRRIILSYLFVMFVLVCVIGGYFVYEKYGKDILSYRKQAKELVANSSESTFRQDETSIVYDANGKKLREVTGEKEVYYKTYDEIPAYFVEAIVSVEDRRFYEHHGVDYEGIMRAAMILFRNKGSITQGASTITQQLARGIFLTKEVSAERTNAQKYERKFKEIFISWELEKKYTKQQILEYYLNTIFFSNGYYGIGAAAKGYFDKDLDELSAAEVAYLCAIPNSPTYYDPRVYPEHTTKRQHKILKDMHELGYLNDIEYEMAMEEDVQPAPEK